MARAPGNRRVWRRRVLESRRCREILLVDDASADGTREILERIRAPGF